MAVFGIIEYYRRSILISNKYTLKNYYLSLFCLQDIFLWWMKIKLPTVSQWHRDIFKLILVEWLSFRLGSKCTLFLSFGSHL